MIATETITCSWCKKSCSEWVDVENVLLPAQRGHSICGVYAMSDVFRARNVRMTRNRAVQPDVIKVIIKQRKSGMNFKDIAHQHGVSVSCVSKLYKRHGNG